MTVPPDRPDIATRDDCERLVRVFYEKAMSDAIIGYLFTDVARLDLEAHIPRITAFWETVLLGTRTYSGTPFEPHARLHEQAHLRAGHFGRWLMLWFESLDELFAGPTAEAAKTHALRVAQAFHGRLQSYPAPPLGADAEPGAALPQPTGAASIVVTRHVPAAR